MITLIQTSQNRRDCLKRFVESLNAQEGIDLSCIQLIFVDQGRNKDVFELLDNRIKFLYILSAPCSLSHARNLALSRVVGDYVAFPDDDCWYEPDTLQNVIRIMMEGGYDGVSGKGTNERGKLTSKFPKHASVITPTKRCSAISYTMFFKYIPSVLFDENMGVGSPYNIGSGEETDYMLTLLEQYKFRIKYDPNIIVHHPCTYDNTTLKDVLNKSYSYARGGGYLIQKHNFPLNYCACQFFRPLAGMIIYAILFKKHNFNKSFLLLKGRLEGYCFKIR